MSTPIRKPTEAQAIAWVKANPDATDDEVYAYVHGLPPSPERFKNSGLLGKVASVVRGVGQTATFGGLDEIGGAIEGALTPGLSMGQGIERHRAFDQGLRESNKKTFMASEIAGAVGTGVGGTKLLMSKGGALATMLGRAGASNLGGRALASGAAGAAGAGATAFGQAEGNPLQRLDETAAAAGVGGVLGAAIPVAGAGLRALGNASHVRPKLVNPVREADDKLNAVIARDGSSPDAIIAKQMETPDVPLGAIDIAGDHTRALAVSAQDRSNTARQKIQNLFEKRADDERERHMGRLDKALNPKHKDIRKTAEELAAIRSAHGQANFPKALEKSVEDVNLAKFFREPEVRRAYTEYRENQLTRKAAGLEADVPPDIYAVSEQGGKRMVKLNTVAIPVKSFHTVQQAINDVIENGFKNGKTMSEDRAKALRDALGIHMDKVEELVPEYGAARKAWRDDSSAIDALEAGLGKVIKNQHGRSIPNFAKSSAEEIDKWLSGRRAAASLGDDVAQADVENYILGVTGNLRDELEGKANPGPWLMRPDNFNRIKAALGGDSKKAREFADALVAERRIKGTSNVNRAGTAIEGDETIPDSAINIGLGIASAAGGRPVGGAVALGRLLRGETNMTDETANAVIERVFAGFKSPQELIDAMTALKAARDAEIGRRARNIGVTSGVAAGATGAVVN